MTLSGQSLANLRAALGSDAPLTLVHTSLAAVDGTDASAVFVALQPVDVAAVRATLGDRGVVLAAGAARLVALLGLAAAAVALLL